MTDLARSRFVRTNLLRAYTEDEFEHNLGLMPSAPIDLDM